MTIPHTRTSAEQLFLDLAEIWIHQHDHMHTLPQGEARGAHEMACDYGAFVIYLLGLIRQHNPHAAEEAAGYIGGTRNWPPEFSDMRSMVIRWIDDTLAHKQLTGVSATTPPDCSPMESLARWAVRKGRDLPPASAGAQKP